VDGSQLKYSQYNCFINYVKELLDIHRSNKNEIINNGGSMNTISLSISQICAFVKVASTMAAEDSRIFFYFLENNYPAMVCDLLRLVKYSVLKEIEFVTSQKRAMTQIEEESYNEVIENSLSLIVQFHAFVSNSYFHQEGSSVPNPYNKFVIELLKPFLYSSSDYVKKKVAAKVENYACINLMHQIKDKKSKSNEDAKKEDDLKYLNRQLFSISIKTVIEQAKKDNYLLEPHKPGMGNFTILDAEMEEEIKSDEDELRKAIEMSLQKESKEDATMIPQNQNVEIRVFDITLDLIKYFKSEIIKN
jgi:hypothetical protein